MGAITLTHLGLGILVSTSSQESLDDILVSVGGSPD